MIVVIVVAVIVIHAIAVIVVFYSTPALSTASKSAWEIPRRIYECLKSSQRALRQVRWKSFTEFTKA